MEPTKPILRSYCDALFSRLLSSRPARRRYQRSAARSPTRGMLARLRFPNSPKRSSAAARSVHPLADVWLLSVCHEAARISPCLTASVSSQTRLRPRPASGVRLGSARCRALETRLAVALRENQSPSLRCRGRRPCRRNGSHASRRRSWPGALD